ncbi:P-loop containing nucleoside triphosphate hydrolase protein [Polychytrium aggregatum]|uniref:P-loop containing nucleoside triphosphate hydrolase protein n=1 Tax=Polychytrium aggregatum TaxID=110093 RepID=UPI0022FE3FD7|nr:P-loop containing nucleoside triphosphate hydrolase protein [Polychytrium aggregatum]KAI9208762.1 P-loop containing nucleoside triphosphate hydrolase protein [Polychytrium aggregatum]
MPVITPEQLVSLQQARSHIRNICILAHVDHGKTTLSDCLLASNGIISPKMSGKIRYLDSREDEQERGITMKSSGISLLFKIIKHITLAGTVDDGTLSQSKTEEDDYLINLIDSPGHVDFSSEVSTASRLCDGALVIVDTVEGVCTQTHTVLKQAWVENVRPIVVLNKIDRLITELKMTPTEAYIHMKNILEQVNAIMAVFYSEDLMQDDARKFEEVQQKNAAPTTSKEDAEALASGLEDWNLEDRDDSNIYFSPEKGNVIFGSAVDGWAFRINQFASIYANKLGIKESLLLKVLWGDFYLDPKTKRVIGYRSLKGRSLKPMFVQFALENIWAVYDAVFNQTDRSKVEKIVKALNLKILPRDMRSKDSKMLLQSICGQWLPLSSSVLAAVVELLPSPLDAQRIRMPKILHPERHISAGNDLAEDADASELDRAVYRCDASANAPIVVYISKMFSVPAKDLPVNKRVQLTAEEMRLRKMQTLRMRQESEGQHPNRSLSTEELRLKRLSALQLQGEGPAPLAEMVTAVPAPEQPKNDDHEHLIGFARIYSGTIKTGQTLHVLGPKYDPRFPDKYRSEIIVEQLYLLMGRELQPLDEVPAGNVFGIGGLDAHVLKTATLSSTPECRSLGGLRVDAPIVRVALEPKDPTQMNQLREGLKLLNQADPSVEVVLQETGEHVILTAGELHLERCLKDLKERFAKIEIQCSPPIVPFRETISKFPSLTATTTGEAKDDTVDTDDDEATEAKPPAALPTGSTVLYTRNKTCKVHVRALPLPPNVVQFLIKSEASIKSVLQSDDSGSHIDDLLSKLKEEFAIAEKEGDLVEPEKWAGVVDRLWAFGPKRIGPNMLVNNIAGYDRAVWIRNAKASGQYTSSNNNELDRAFDDDARESLEDSEDGQQDREGQDEGPVDGDHILGAKDFDGSINTSFQLATQVGPMCAEPIMGVCYFVEEFEIDAAAQTSKVSSLSGQILATFKDACKQAFLGWSPRLMLAMYSCELQAPAEVLGKVYAVLAKRRGRIISEEMKDGTPFFNIKSLLPVVESFGFNDDIRKRTSGAASPQLIFSGFEVLDQDPYWVPTTEEELEDLGEKADRENLAKKYLENVRKRKGLFVERKIVEHAEKQQTLKKK